VVEAADRAIAPRLGRRRAGRVFWFVSTMLYSLVGILSRDLAEVGRPSPRAGFGGNRGDHLVAHRERWIMVRVRAQGPLG